MTTSRARGLIVEAVAEAIRNNSTSFFAAAEAAVTVLIGALGEPCGRCDRRFDDLRGEVIGKGVGKVPGRSVGSNWDWVTCPDCKGSKRLADTPPLRLPCANVDCTNGQVAYDVNRKWLPNGQLGPCPICGGSGVGELAVLAGLGMEQVGHVRPDRGFYEFAGGDGWDCDTPEWVPVYAARAVKEDQ